MTEGKYHTDLIESCRMTFGFPPKHGGSVTIILRAEAPTKKEAASMNRSVDKAMRAWFKSIAEQLDGVAAGKLADITVTDNERGGP